jgi:predicted HicB family RNase H-like nuclease
MTAYDSDTTAMAKRARPTRRHLRDSRINLRLREDLHLKLAALAHADGRSLSSYVERVLEKHVAELKAK